MVHYPCIAAMDFATVTGFCVGSPGKKPVFGSQRMGPVGSPDAAVYAAAFKFGADIARDHNVNRVRYEATIDPRHLGPKTTRKTCLRLGGIPAAATAAFYLCQVTDIEEIRAQKVRDWLLGCRPKKDVMKAAVMAAVLERGFDVEGDDNAADAVAIWLHYCHLSGFD